MLTTLLMSVKVKLHNRDRMGTKQQRAADHAKRSEEFNKRADKELRSMQVTDELLRMRCTLWITAVK